MNFKQSSTWRGLALIGSAIASAFGFGHFFTAEVTNTGLELGGAIGLAVPFVVGAYDAIRDEFKDKDEAQ